MRESTRVLSRVPRTSVAIRISLIQPYQYAQLSMKDLCKQYTTLLGTLNS